MAKIANSPPVGRPSFYGERMKNRNVRLTDAQWAAFLALGGPDWLRSAISQASNAAEPAKENQS